MVRSRPAGVSDAHFNLSREDVEKLPKGRRGIVPV
jgi:hypothetical protein